MARDAPTRPSIRPAAAVPALVVAVICLVACSSGSASSGSSAASASASVSASVPARSAVPEPSTDLERVSSWCAALAARSGAGEQASASRPVLVRDLGQLEARAAAATWPGFADDALLGECAIGLPLRFATPEPSVAPGCPSGKATVTRFPPTRAWLVDASGHAVRLPKATAYGPEPLVQCT